MGIDSDPAMIAWAERHLPASLSTPPTYVLDDISSFHRVDRFREVICPCNTLSLLNASQAKRALRRAYEHLLHGGVFAAELAHPRDLQADDIDSTQPLAAFCDPETLRPVQIYASQRFDARRQAADVEWRWDELQPDGSVLRRTYRDCLTLWHPDEIGRALLAAGFAGSSVLGGYGGERYDEHSGRMLVVATRP
jgi:hypothetical protein